MPIYEYTCSDCGARFELIRPMGDETQPPCSTCQSPHTEKALSAPAVHTHPATPCGSHCGTEGSRPPCHGGGSSCCCHS